MVIGFTSVKDHDCPGFFMSRYLSVMVKEGGLKKQDCRENRRRRKMKNFIIR